MKKIIRRIAALICIVTLFAAPATAFADSVTVFATPEPVLDFQIDGIISISYSPGPLFLEIGSSVYIPKNITRPDGRWFVPAGQSIRFQVFAQEMHVIGRVLAFRNGQVMMDEIITSTIGGYMLYMDPGNDDATWEFLILPFSDMNIIGYGCSVF